MKHALLTEAEVDRLLQRVLVAPQPGGEWRQRVLAATLHSGTAAQDTARTLALNEARAQARRSIAAQRQALLRQILPYALIAIVSLALLPALAAHLAPVFGTVPRLGLDGFSLTIGVLTLCAGLATGFPRQARELLSG